MKARFSLFFLQLSQVWKQHSVNSTHTCRNRRATGFKTRGIAAQIEDLEQRTLLSGTNILAATVLAPTFELAHPFATSTPSGLTPSQMQVAYGFNHVTLQNGINGTGQTIAIVDAYDAPTVLSDLQAFDRAFGLPNPPSLTVMSQTGSTTTLPGTDPNPNRQLDWEVEEALDVEWAHALAPGAKIVLVEANSPQFSDLLAAVTTAAKLPGVSVVSMSWGGSEFSSESSFDSIFATPAGHAGVTFVAASGDSGAGGGYPAMSPNVLAVGGTTLVINSSGTASESGWSGSGGGISTYESQPTYQKGVVTQTTTKRSNPDVAFDADPNTGVPVYASFSNGTSNPWAQIGGTSLSAPAWAGVISIVDQGRSQNGLASMDGATQTLPLLYQLDVKTPSAFHDITTGSNGYSAGPGYDLVTGIGTPVVNLLVTGLSGATPTTSKLVIQQSPTTGTAGVVLSSMKVAIENQSGQVITTNHSTVTVSIASGPGGFTSGSKISVAAVNGVATFTNLVLNVAGSYTLSVSDTGLTSATSHNFTISAAAAIQLAFRQQPTTGTTGQSLNPAVTVVIEDQFGNVATTNTSTVTISVASGPGIFSSASTILVSAVSGIATFNKLILATAGNYALRADDAGMVTATSNAFTVNAPLAAPRNVAAIALSSTTARVSWILSSGAQGYRVFQVTGSQSVLLGTVGATISSFQITGLTPGSTVSFKVEAFRGSAIADSAVVSVTMPQVILGTPILTIQVLTSTSVQLNWTPVAGTQGFRIYYSDGLNRLYLGTLGSGVTTVTAYGLLPWATYQFQVEAFQGTTVKDSAWVPVSTQGAA